MQDADLIRRLYGTYRKQQKEIEELKDIQQKICEEKLLEQDYVKEKFIPKSKIQDKLDLYSNKRSIFNYDNEIRLLEELLESEKIMEIKWENEKTKIPEDLFCFGVAHYINEYGINQYKRPTGMLQDFYEMGFIDKMQPLNADFLNKYHFEIYIPIYKKIKWSKFLVKLLGKYIFKKERKT